MWLFPKSEEGVGCRTQQERLTGPPFSGTDGGEREYVGVCIEDQRSCESYSFHGLSGPLAPRTGWERGKESMVLACTTWRVFG